MNILVSVVVPVYNAECFIRECIESVMRQSFANFELLLVDDGSTDNSYSICMEYAKKDSRIKVISQNHVGPYEARKSGVMQSKGDYVTFLDADDFIDAEAYALALEDMNASVDVIIFDIFRYFNNDDIRYDGCLLDKKIYNRSEIESKIHPSMIWDEMQNKSGIDSALWNKLYKAELLRRYYNTPRNISFHYGEDAAVVYPVLKDAMSISVHHDAYYYHRQREKGVIAPYIQDSQYLDKLYELYSSLMADLGADESFRRQIDLFYMYSVQLAKIKYGIAIYLPDNIFPFDKINKGDKIVLYGAGNIGRLYMKQLRRLKFCEIVLWVDKGYEQLEKEICSPSEIVNAEYDKIVIAIADSSIVNKVIQYLVDMGVDSAKIVL